MALNAVVSAYKASGLIPVLTVSVRSEVDIVGARQRARQLALMVGLGSQDQVRVATAVSELARNAYQQGGGRVQFALALSPRPQALWVTITDDGPVTPNMDEVANGREAAAGLIASRRLMDLLEVKSVPGSGTVIDLAKFLPSEPRIESSGAMALSTRLTQQVISAPNESQLQNRDLLETLETLRLRDLELEKRHAEMRRINAELEETNRGVMALYAELDEKAGDLRRADELKGLFLRHVSHEFRTPLNSILALTLLLLRRTDGDLSGEQERQVGYIRKAAQDLTDMVNDLLDLAKVEAGKTEVHTSRIHLGQLFGALRGIMRPLVAGDAISLVFEEPSDLLYFESDESKVAQILRNLVSNALKFTERGEVRISSAVSGDWLEIAVADTGIGIASEDLERIFQEFAQVNNSIQRRVKGTGLGLPLSRKLATLLGGELTVASRPGEGATFTLKLPAMLNRGHVAETQAGQASILIIDDEDAARYIVKHRLRGTRYRIIEAASGIEGAERARFERPALIFLDLVMPDRDGFEVLDDLKGHPLTRGIPVFIHTSRRLVQADFERLAGRHAGIVPKDQAWSGENLERIRALLRESDLFSDEPFPGESA